MLVHQGFSLGVPSDFRSGAREKILKDSKEKMTLEGEKKKQLEIKKRYRRLSFYGKNTFAIFLLGLQNVNNLSPSNKQSNLCDIGVYT